MLVFYTKKIYRKNGVKHELSDSNPAKTVPYYPIKTPGAIAPGALVRILMPFISPCA